MSSQQPKIKAVFFDFMGTCLDWHSSVVKSLPPAIPSAEASELALEWRKQYFVYNEQRVQQNLNPEDIDISLAQTLDVVLSQFSNYKSLFDADVKRRLIEAWHSQPAWPEVKDALQVLREEMDLETFVHGNGTTRLQVDLTRFSGLSFNMLFSSQLLGVYKPNPAAYKKVLELLKLDPEEVVMVAAHIYDLRGATQCGMKTTYIHRWTDDVDEDMEVIKQEVDVFLEDMEKLPSAIASI
ncbi:hypothetical protein N0V84_001481 [Fusarium piperis]|uniref:Haloacid dehalogenase n=1 Tax=Fusarium piperis TaxID=1435070 RepID=A0A9W9BT10_9HYPO|nr:hypothetical protein N0V84_001481 [Fusarium piperis]